MKTKYKYINFTEVEAEPKNRWNCRNNRPGDLLGTVEWYAKWKQYEFIPQYGMGFTIECLLDIADFIKQLERN